MNVGGGFSEVSGLGVVVRDHAATRSLRPAVDDPIYGGGIVGVLRAKVLQLNVEALAAAREVEQANWLVTTELALNLWLSIGHLA